MPQATPRAPVFQSRASYTACADDIDFIYHLRAMRQTWIAAAVAGMLWTAVQGHAPDDSQDPPAGTSQQGRGAGPQRGAPGREGGGQRANFPQQQRAPGDPAVTARGRA